MSENYLRDDRQYMMHIFTNTDDLVTYVDGGLLKNTDDLLTCVDGTSAQTVKKN